MGWCVRFMTGVDGMAHARADPVGSPSRDSVRPTARPLELLAALVDERVHPSGVVSIAPDQVEARADHPVDEKVADEPGVAPGIVGP